MNHKGTEATEGIKKRGRRGKKEEGRRKKKTSPIPNP